MSEIRIASRYAKSLFALSGEQGSMDAVNTDMGTIQKVISENFDLRAMLHSPVIKTDVKNTILIKVFSQCTPLTLNFLSMVVDARREGFLNEIAGQFTALYNDLKGIARASVTTSVPVDEALTQKIREYIAGKINKKEVQLSMETDQDIIGGLIISYEDKLLDMSVKSELNKLKKQLNQQ